MDARVDPATAVDVGGGVAGAVLFPDAYFKAVIPSNNSTFTGAMLMCLWSVLHSGGCGLDGTDNPRGVSVCVSSQTDLGHMACL